MILSTFLAKLLGLYFIIISLLWIFRHQQLVASCKEMILTKGLLALSGEFSLVFGLVIAIDHTIWEWSWQGLVTLLGYLLILRGILRLAFPAFVKSAVSKMVKDSCWPIFLVMLAIGVYLAYCGFAFHPDEISSANNF